MNHKRKKRRNIRAGCKMCKPWKVNGASKEKPEFENFGSHKRRMAAKHDVLNYLDGEFGAAK